jgi:hypothetical protein
MKRIGLTFATRAVLALVVIGAVAGAAVAAERHVLGEYFTATW